VQFHRQVGRSSTRRLYTRIWSRSVKGTGQGIYKINCAIKNPPDHTGLRFSGKILKGSVQFHSYSLHCSPFGNVTSGLRRPSPLACPVGHAAAFAVNAALVASQW